MMEHGKIPQQASHKKFNPKILTHAQDRMELPRTLVPWNAPFYLACVNSYGAAGSNAAALIRQGPSSKAKQSNGIAKDVAGTDTPCLYLLHLRAASFHTAKRSLNGLEKPAKGFRCRILLSTWLTRPITPFRTPSQRLLGPSSNSRRSSQV